MPRLSRCLVAPMYRHFWPVVPITDPIHFYPPPTRPRTALSIDMNPYLVQGAKPLDPALISKADNQTAFQFQGGYRCSLKIALQPAHGTVTIVGGCFEFVAATGYVGSDSFAYQIVNVMGQGSQYGYINLLIRC